MGSAEWNISSTWGRYEFVIWEAVTWKDNKECIIFPWMSALQYNLLDIWWELFKMYWATRKGLYRLGDIEKEAKCFSDTDYEPHSIIVDGKANWSGRSLRSSGVYNKVSRTEQKLFWRYEPIQSISLIGWDIFDALAVDNEIAGS